MKKSVILGMLMASFLASLGCAPSTDPNAEKVLTYAEAVTIYNQELAALHTLQQQRKSLQEQLDMPSLGGVSDLLESAGKLQGDLGATLDELSDPARIARAKPKAKSDDSANGTADSDADAADAKTEEAKAADPLEQLSAEIKAVGEKQNEKVGEIEKQIAELDQQIVEQQARVDRAKADRDAAEAAR